MQMETAVGVLVGLAFFSLFNVQKTVVGPLIMPNVLSVKVPRSVQWNLALTGLDPSAKFRRAVDFGVENLSAPLA